MIVSPTIVSMPVTTPSHNPPTDQVARANRLREKIISPREVNPNSKEPNITQQEKQLRKPSWDPFEHPDYSHLKKKKFTQRNIDYYSGTHLQKMAEMLSGKSFLPKVEQGYTVKMKLPPELLEKMDKIRKSKTNTVVAMRYQQASAPHMPSEMLVVI